MLAHPEDGFTNTYAAPVSVDSLFAPTIAVSPLMATDVPAPSPMICAVSVNSANCGYEIGFLAAPRARPDERTNNPKPQATLIFSGKMLCRIEPPEGG